MGRRESIRKVKEERLIKGIEVIVKGWVRLRRSRSKRVS